MKTRFNYLFLSLFTFAILYSCSGDDDSGSETILSSTKQITKFIFNATSNEALDANITTTINENDKTITAQVPYGTNVTSLAPTIEVSPKAIVSPEGAQDFSTEATYTVTAEDGTEANYTVTVTITSNNEAQINSFSFLAENNSAIEETITATIDEDTKTITAEVPHGTDITGLMPTLEVSPNATFTPEGAQDFSSEVVYTVTAQDGTIAEYTLHLTIALSQREVLTAIYNANPGNTLGWDLNDPDINNWPGVGTDDNNNVIALVLRYNSLTTIPAEIGQLSNLTNLNLNGNQITGLPAEIGQLSKLTSCDISFNELTIIPAEIGQLSNLTKLDLSENNLTALPSEMGQLINLTLLQLSSNLITNFPAEIGQLTNLGYLSCESNELTAIPSEMGQLTKLRVLQLGGNQLTSIPSEIGQLIKLEDLYLSNNQLTSIPVEIGQLINLTHLNLNKNQLTALPSEIGQLNNLTVLYLHYNQLTALPLNIGQLTNLTELNLDGNQLTSISTQIGQLTNLTRLHLESNLVTSIPQVVCDLNTNHGTIIYTDEGVTCQ